MFITSDLFSCNSVHMKGTRGYQLDESALKCKSCSDRIK